MAQLVSPHDCELGKWLYSKGLDKYSTMPNMHKLEKIHVELHEITKRIVEHKESLNTPMAENEYSKLEHVSGEIISLLTSIEQEIK